MPIISEHTYYDHVGICPVHGRHRALIYMLRPDSPKSTDEGEPRYDGICLHCMRDAIVKLGLPVCEVVAEPRTATVIETGGPDPKDLN